MTVENRMSANREIITSAHENQILYAEFAGANGQKYSGVCQVKQIVRKRGKGGETFAIVRFHGDNRMLRLGWRDARIMGIKTLELEDLEAYFLYREKQRHGQGKGVDQSSMNMETAAQTASPSKPHAKRGRKPKTAVRAPAPQPDAQFQSPAEAFAPSQQSTAPIAAAGASNDAPPPPVAPPNFNPPFWNQG